MRPARLESAGTGPFAGLRAAIGWLSKRVSRTVGGLSRMKDAAAERGFAIARVLRRRTVEEIKTSLANSLAKGDTLEAWRNDKLRRITGTESISNAHAQTIYRTEFQKARQAAMRQEWKRPAFAGWIVAYEYLTMDDDRVREEHEKLHGTILAADDPRVAEWWPPNGFNCRCMFLPIDRLEAEARGLEPDQRVPDFQPDPGFDGPPEGT